MSRGQRDVSLRPYSRFSRQEPLLFYQVAPQLYSRGWVDRVPDPLLFFSGSAGNRTRDPCICSQELWPLDHRGGLGTATGYRNCVYEEIASMAILDPNIIQNLNPVTPTALWMRVRHRQLMICRPLRHPQEPNTLISRCYIYLYSSGANKIHLHTIFVL
jgi:hypothetical protein